MLRALALVLLLSACPRASDSPAQSAPDARVEADAAVDAGPEASDAGPSDAGLPVLTLTLTAATDGGTSLVTVGPDGRAELEPTATLILEFPTRLRDYRVRLFDDRDLVLPSDDAATLTDGGLLYEVDLLQPLAPGRSYLLMVDGELGPQVLDQEGRAHEDVRLVLNVRGEPVREEWRRTPVRRRSR